MKITKNRKLVLFALALFLMGAFLAFSGCSSSVETQTNAELSEINFLFPEKVNYLVYTPATDNAPITQVYTAMRA